MASFNMTSVMKKCDDYMKTPAGQKKMYDCANGRVEGACKAVKKNIKERAIEMIPFSPYGGTLDVYKDIDSLQMNEVEPIIEKTSKGIRVKATMDFKADLTRQSVQPDRYPRGVDNIIALFNSGYSAANSIRGYWENADAKIWTRPWRSYLGFMQAGINDLDPVKFRGVDVQLNDVYK